MDEAELSIPAVILFTQDLTDLVDAVFYAYALVMSCARRLGSNDFSCRCQDGDVCERALRECLAGDYYLGKRGKPMFICVLTPTSTPSRKGGDAEVLGSSMLPALAPNTGGSEWATIFVTKI